LRHPGKEFPPVTKTCLGCLSNFPTLKKRQDHQKNCAEWLQRKEQRKKEKLAQMKKLSTQDARSMKGRERRSKILTALNKTKVFREKASETAKKTSARPEIQKQRAAVLKKWREENPEKIKEILAKGRQSPKNSKAEIWIMENHLQKRNFQNKHSIMCGKKSKEVDFVRENIWIEIDGCWHFGPEFTKHTRYTGENVHKRDLTLIQEAQRRKIVTLIRVGVDCMMGHGKTKIKPEWEKLFLQIVDDPIPNIYLFGESYLSNIWEKDICTTWKYVINPTTFVYKTEL